MPWVRCASGNVCKKALKVLIKSRYHVVKNRESVTNLNKNLEKRLKATFLSSGSEENFGNW